MRARWVLLSVFFLAALRPPDLEQPKECDLWKGTVSGNDPSVEVQLILCTQEKDAVEGTLQWSSERSGWSRRAVSGTKKADDKKVILSLRDDKFLENKPNSGWRFCLVDEYKLTQNKERISGSYTSADCQDQASVSLTLQPKK